MKNLRAYFILILVVQFSLFGGDAGKLSVSSLNGSVSYSYPISSTRVNNFGITCALSYQPSVKFTAYKQYNRDTSEIGLPGTPSSRDGWEQYSKFQPAWIMGVNGFAINVLHSSTNFPSVMDSIDEDGINYHIEGYDVCNRVERLNLPSDRDIIKILRSDGTILELSNKKTLSQATSVNDPALYTGYYYVNGMGTNIYAIVEFDTVELLPNHFKWRVNSSTYKTERLPRKVRVYFGDGLEYVFKEHIFPFGNEIDSRKIASDIWYPSNYAEYAMPSIFYFEEINSAERNIVKFEREFHNFASGDSTFHKGRAPIKSFFGHRFTFENDYFTIEAMGRTIKARNQGFFSLPRVSIDDSHTNYKLQSSYAGMGTEKERRSFSETPQSIDFSYFSHVGYVSEIFDAENLAASFYYKKHPKSVPNGKNIFYRIDSICEPSYRAKIEYHKSNDIIELDTMTNYTRWKLDPDFTDMSKEVVYRSSTDNSVLSRRRFGFNNYIAGYIRKVWNTVTDEKTHVRDSTEDYYLVAEVEPLVIDALNQNYTPNFLIPELAKKVRYVDTVVTTVYTEYSPVPTGSRFFRFPIREWSTIKTPSFTSEKVVSCTKSQFEFQNTPMLTFGGDTSISNHYGKVLKKVTSFVCDPVDTTKILVSHVNEFIHLNGYFSSTSRLDTMLQDYASIRSTDSLRNLGVDTTVFVYSVTGGSSRGLYVPPILNLPTRSFYYDSTGRTRVGSGRKYNTFFNASGTGAYIRGALLADSLFSEDMAEHLQVTTYEYTGGGFQNYLVSSVSMNGAKSVLKYKYNGTEYGQLFRNNDTYNQQKIYNRNIFTNAPIGSETLVRKGTYDASSSSYVGYIDTLKSYVERSYYSQVIASINSNGYYNAQEYDNLGRRRYSWSPKDFPTSWYSGGNRVKLWDISTDRIERYDTLVFASGTCGGTPVSILPGNTTITTTRYDICRDYKTNASESITQCSNGRKVQLIRDEVARIRYRANSLDYIHQSSGGNNAKLKVYFTQFVDSLSVGWTYGIVNLKVEIPKFSFSESFLVDLEQRDTLLDAQGIGYFEVDVTGILSQLRSMPNNDTMSILLYISNTTPNGDFKIATFSEDVMPSIVLSGESSNSRNRNADFTSNVKYIDGSKQAVTLRKVDDQLTTQNPGWTANSSILSGRYAGIRSEFGHQGRLLRNLSFIGNPFSPTRTDTVSLFYTGLGRVDSIVDQEGYATRVSKFSRSSDSVFFADGSIVYSTIRIATPQTFGFTSSDWGNICVERAGVDERGRKSVAFIDGYGRLRITIKDSTTSGGLKVTTKYLYDNLNRLVCVVTPRGDSTKYWYDKWGRIEYKYNPDIGYISYSYNRLGQLRFAQTQQQATDGKVTFIQYDDLGRISLVGEADLERDAFFLTPNDSLNLYRFTRKLNAESLNDDNWSTIPTVNKTLFMTSSVGDVPVVPTGTTISNSCTADTSEEKFPPYLVRPVQNWNRPASTLAPRDKFENVWMYPHFVLKVCSFDKLPQKVGTVWKNMPDSNTLNALSPKGYVRNLRGKTAAIAYRDHGGQPFHYTFYSYDERGRTEAVIHYTENLGFDAVYYKYNSAGAVTRVKVSDPFRSHYTWYSYDNNGRMERVWSRLDANGSGVGVNSPSYSADIPRSGLNDIRYMYNKRGSVDSISYVVINATVKYNFNARGFLDSIKAKQGSTVLFYEALDRDASGMIVQQTSQHRNNPVKIESYQYDGLDRLVRWDVNLNITGEWQYDIVGNRQVQTEQSSTVTNYTYSGNKLIHLETSSKDVDYSYDGDGSLTNRTTTEVVSANYKRTFEKFVYNSTGLVDQYLRGEVIGTDTSCMSAPEVLQTDWRYRYNAQGVREQKRLYSDVEQDTNDGTYPWSYYLIGARGEQRAVWVGAQTRNPDTCGNTGRKVYMRVQEYIVYGALGAEIEGHLNSLGQLEKHVHFKDHLGSVRAVFSSVGNQHKAMDYKPFGGVAWSMNGTQRTTFIGKELDKESDLGDFGARKYDASIGRFTAIDPIWEMFSAYTPYHYCNNSPINFLDPSGFQMEQEVTATAGVTGEANGSDPDCTCDPLKPCPKHGTIKSSGGSGGTHPDAGNIGVIRMASGLSNGKSGVDVKVGGEAPGLGGGGGGGNSRTGDATNLVFPDANTASIALSGANASPRWGWTANGNTEVKSTVEQHDITDNEITVNKIYEPNEFGVGDFQKQVNGFASVWDNPQNRQYAPAVAAHLKSTQIALVLADIGGESQAFSIEEAHIIAVDITTYQGKSEDSFEQNLLHELVHDMGGSEFDAFAAEMAAGYVSPEEYWENLQNGLHSYNGWYYGYMLMDIKKSGFNMSEHFVEGNIYRGIINKENFLKAVYNHGQNVIKKGLKK